MSDTAQRAMRKKNVGDAAVDGLFAGILAGLSMAAYLVLSGLLSGTAPKIILGRFDPGMDGNWLAGTVAHLAVSAVYGVVFALLFSLVVRWRPTLQRFGWLAGLLYGLILQGVALAAFSAVVNSDLAQYAPPVLLLAHIVYGVLLGFLISRKWRPV